MTDEVVEHLRPQPGKTLVDGTVGGGGHARRLAATVSPDGLVIALDRDPAALAAAGHTLAGQPIKLVDSDYCDLPEVLQTIGVEAVDGILLDLGLSSDQLADDARGFSFNSSGPLDLRFDPRRGQPAWRLLERLRQEHLADVLYRYGEERFSRRIARSIVDRRRADPIRTATQLAELVRRCVPRPRRSQRRIDPATRTFQALRIAVNDELRSLEIALRRLADCLVPGGRFVVLSYHSLEDRLVKEAFRDDARYEALGRRPIRPTADEIAANVRARSARMRVAQRSGCARR